MENMENKEYIKLENLKVYQLARELSKSRFHYLDKIKFLYTSRASLNECRDHWLELLNERKKIDAKNYEEFKAISSELSIRLNNFISSIYKSKNNRNS